MGFVVLAPLLVFIVYKIKRRNGRNETPSLNIIIISMVLAGSISGCSELEEIEERGFVVGAAYDIVKEKKSNPIMKGTYQMVLPSKLAATRWPRGWR